MSNTQDLHELNFKIYEWAREKGILEKATTLGQAEKTLEEAQELKDAILADDKAEIIDAIGDIFVTIAIQAEMQGVSLGHCVESAYNVIKGRKGKMINGQFVKESE